MKRVFVTGGTGFVGAHVVKKLIDRGDHVVALARPRSNTSLLDGLRVDIASGDITNLDSMLWPMRGCSELYHIAADYRLWARNPDEIYFNNVVGTLNVMEAAMRAGVGRVVYTSTVGCLGSRDQAIPANEKTPVERDQLVGNYKKSKYDAEQTVLEYVDKGLNAVIVNPSTPVGPGDIKPTPTGRIIVDFINGAMTGYLDTGLNLIAVEDVAQGHLLAAEKGKTGEKYILGNQNLTLKDIFGMLSEITGRPAPTFRVPYSLAMMASLVCCAVAVITEREPSVPLEGVLMARKKMFFSSEKATRELGLPQSSVEEALMRAVRWFDENGYVRPFEPQRAVTSRLSDINSQKK